MQAYKRSAERELERDGKRERENGHVARVGGKIKKRHFREPGVRGGWQISLFSSQGQR